MPGDDGLIGLRAVLSPDAAMDPETHERRKPVAAFVPSAE